MPTIKALSVAGSKAEVPLEALDDAAVIQDIVLKSDSYTVKPLLSSLLMIRLFAKNASEALRYHFDYLSRSLSGC